MPIYIPVYQRRLDPETGEPMYNPDGEQIMDQVDTIVVPDPEPSAYELTSEELAQMQADQSWWSQSQQDSPIVEDPTQNP